MNTQRNELATVLETAYDLNPGMGSFELLAHAVLAAGYTRPRTVTEWAAGFERTGNIYNVHRTQEEAQKFVDEMRELGADMVVMTREVLPQDASDWSPVVAG